VANEGERPADPLAAALDDLTSVLGQAKIAYALIGGLMQRLLEQAAAA
jgi:hypothetical protein